MQKTTLSLIVSCSLLAACGGGGGGTATDSAQSPTQDVSAPAGQTPEVSTAPVVPSTETSGGETSATDAPVAGVTVSPDTPSVDVPPPPPSPPPPPISLAFFSFDTATSDVSSGTGELDQFNDRFTIAGFSGTINSDGTMVVLDGGGQIALPSGDTKDVGLFQLETATGNPSFGVYGSPTDLMTFSPGAGATYTGEGTAVVQIIDGTRLYDLNGDLTAEVNFAGRLVDISISDLQGERTDGISAPEQVMDVVQISITGGQLTGGTFEGGTASFTSTQISTPLSGSETVASTGALFGDSAQDIGGVFVVDDSASVGNLLVRGQYLGD